MQTRHQHLLCSYLFSSYGMAYDMEKNNTLKICLGTHYRLHHILLDGLDDCRYIFCGNYLNKSVLSR